MREKQNNNNHNIHKTKRSNIKTRINNCKMLNTKKKCRKSTKKHRKTQNDNKIIRFFNCKYYYSWLDDDDPLVNGETAAQSSINS